MSEIGTIAATSVGPRGEVLGLAAAAGADRPWAPARRAAVPAGGGRSIVRVGPRSGARRGRRDGP